MKTVKILSEQNTYTGNTRICLQTVETITNLSDDMMIKANYECSLASNQNIIEKLSQRILENPNEQEPLSIEIERIKGEMSTLRQAILLQEQYILGFNVE